MATDPPPQNAAAFGQYQLVRLLGKGGMGEVYEAFDPNLARPVALKKMSPQLTADPDAQARFLREARAVAALKNDHVVTIHHVGKRSGVLYLVMEMLDGQSLDKRLATGPELTAAEACRVAREIALGLAAAHEKGLVHRDIKPANVWLERGGRVKILDFGLVSAATADQKLTTPGVVMGTPPFMSPEQARGEEVDPRSDLFSLGTVLYRLVAGRLPFDGASTVDVLHAVTHAAQPPVRQVNRQADADLAQIIDWLLNKNPADRPQTAAQVADALLQVSRRLPAGDAGRPATVPSPVAPTLPHYSTLDRAKDAAREAGSTFADSLKLTFDHARKVGRFGSARYRTRKLSKQFQDDLVAFGAALAAAGLGEPALLRRLAELEDQIANLKAAGRAPGPAADERRGVLIRVATPFAERDSVPPEVERRTELTTAYTLARTSLLDFDTARRQAEQGRTELIPTDPRARRRLLIGVGAVGVVPLLAGLWLVSGGGPTVVAGVTDKAVVQATVGRVVCGGRVVLADGEAREVPVSTGTAFAVTPDGVLLTNEHVVHDVRRWKNLGDVPAEFKKFGWKKFEPAVWVVFGGRKVEAALLYESADHDMAVLKVDRTFPAVFALRADPAVGFGVPVIAIGYPDVANIPQSAEEAARRKLLGATLHPRVEKYFTDREFEVGVTGGRVSRVTTTDGETVVQHDAAIHPGNSGGPLILEDGTVVGINTRKADAAGVSFALGLPQLKAEIAPHARGVVWK